MNNIQNIKCNYIDGKLNIYLTPTEYEYMTNKYTTHINSNINLTHDVKRETIENDRFEILNKKINKLNKKINKLNKKNK